MFSVSSSQTCLVVELKNHADVWKYHQNPLRVFGPDISVVPGFTSTWQRRQNQGKVNFLQEAKYTKVWLDGVMGEYLKSINSGCKPLILSSCAIFRRVRLRLRKRQYWVMPKLPKEWSSIRKLRYIIVLPLFGFYIAFLERQALNQF